MKNLAILLTFLFTSSLTAQFTLNGSTVDLGGGCYELTPAVNGQAASMWNQGRINLDQPFTMTASINYGANGLNNGADGIAFGLQSQGINALGISGGGLGWNGITPGIAAVFRTWTYDILHFSTSDVLVPVSGTTPLPEDNNFHSIMVTWDPNTTTLELYFDGVLQVTHVDDIKNNVFGGNNLVYWGFTASTGGANNIQQVCDIVMSRPIGQYSIIGSTVDLGGGCYELTPALNSQAGSMWNQTQLNLDELFTMTASITYGANGLNNGADGIAFGLQSQGLNAIGISGGGLGWNGITPGIAAVFRTWTYDIMHFSTSDVLVPVSATTPLPEDNNIHDIKVTWNPNTTTLELYFDGVLQVTYVDDIKNNIFGGNNMVYWGFTASTGGANNIQQVCDIVMNAVPIPTLSQWGIIILGLMIGCIGIVTLYSRKRKLTPC